MHTTQRPRIVAAIAILTLWAASAQAQTQQFAKVRITSTASDALCVGGAGVTPSSCTGGAKAGTLDVATAVTLGGTTVIDSSGNVIIPATSKLYLAATSYITESSAGNVRIVGSASTRADFGSTIYFYDPVHVYGTSLALDSTQKLYFDDDYLWQPSSDAIAAIVGGAELFRVTSSGVTIGTNAKLSAIAANTLRLVNGGSSASPVPQELQVYGYHDGTAYESIFLRHTGDGVGRIGLRSSGTTDRFLNVYLGGGDRFQFNASGGYFITLSGFSLGTTSYRWGGIYGTGTGLDLKGAGTSRMRQYVDPWRNDVWITSANYAGTLGAGTQDSGSLPSWLTYFDLRAGADNFLIARYPAGSSTEAALVIVESDGVIKNNGVAITTSAGKLVGSAITGLSGSWTSKSSDTVYYADTAGWAVVLVACGDYPEDCGAQVSMLTDASNPPTTARDYGSVDSYHSAVNQSGARAFVRAGDYWKAVSSTISGSPAVTVWWQPIGG